ALSKHWLAGVLAYLATAAFLLYALLTIVALCRVRAGAPAELGIAIAFLMGMMLCRPPLLAIIAFMLKVSDEAAGPLKWLAQVPGLWTIGTICLILMAGFLGRLVGRVIREANLLLVVTVVAAGIDLWGVYWGPVGQITSTEKGRAIAEQLSAAIPGVSAATRAGLPVLTAIGIGDFLFVAMFFAVLRRLRLNQRATFWAVFAIMTVAPAFFLLGDRLPIAENLPGLPFIGAGTIIANWKHFKFSRQEKHTLLIGAAIIILLICAILLIKRLIA
ncbi:MAG: hypothetical protein GTO55_10915, partial [Armatimonadetes bacterium]|nr:hypothetical protein [Armatimonadota bacterium]NIM24741.1 hypothetical protein [Armatimonadota bacterium]NIM68621.1 hypothetical protein [Armatimonadota bacterium]NIM77138.1 hypothetical protein [Armatimonadota bacterium]NIN06815.1 hypothetical protein [Armatimonadota bacterium]